VGFQTRQENNAVRHTLLALVIVAMAAPALAPPALAQARGGGPPNVMAESDRSKAEDAARAAKEAEAGYKSGIGRIPDAKAKQDPWGGVRSGTTATQTKPNTK
jgi:hypothetical protein